MGIYRFRNHTVEITLPESWDPGDTARATVQSRHGNSRYLFRYDLLIYPSDTEEVMAERALLYYVLRIKPAEKQPYRRKLPDDL